MTENSFYVVLPSNASEGNTPSKFHTTLQKPIEIDYPEEWEVGLLEINFKNSLKTIYENDKIEVIHSRITFTPSKENQVFVLGNTTYTNWPVAPAVNEVFVETNRSNVLGLEQVTDGYYYSLEPAGETIIFKTDEKETPDFLFKYLNEKVYLVNNMEQEVNIEIPWFYAESLGFVRKCFGEGHLQTYDPFTIYNVKPGTTEAPNPPLLSRVEDKTVIVSHPGHSKPGAENTYNLVYLDREVTEEKVASISPKSGKYVSAKKLAAQFVDNELNKYFKLEYDERLNSFKLITVKHAEDPEREEYEIVFSGGIHEVLGFNLLRYETSTTERVGDLQVDLERGLSNIFIYCDLCEHIRVGNTTAPLLRPISFNTHKYGEMIHSYYINPMFVPINKSFIDTIEVRLCDATGQVIGFVEGLTTIVLHFKRL